MGAWGTSIFSDDTACDVRDTYEDLLRYNRTPEEAERLTIAELEMANADVESSAWLALAATEWRCGRLLSDIALTKAIHIIDNDVDINLWETDKQKESRRKALVKLRKQLLSPLPRAKTLKPLPVIHSPWNIGDIIAVKMPDVDKYPLTSGQYALLHVISIKKVKNSKYAPDTEYSEIPYFLVFNWFGSDPLTDANVIDDNCYAIKVVHGIEWSKPVTYHRAVLRLDISAGDEDACRVYQVVGHKLAPSIETIRTQYDGCESANCAVLSHYVQRWLGFSEHSVLR